MIMSFTISKKPNIYTPQPKMVEKVNTSKQDQQFNGDEKPSTIAQTRNEKLDDSKGDPTMSCISTSAKTIALFQSTFEQLQALGPSITLNLYPKGFTISNNIEEFLIDVPYEDLILYSKETKLILKDIERGRLPTCISNAGIECKYVNGTILCEVRDYRIFVAEPYINQVPLKMGPNNVEEDLKSIYKHYSDMDILKIESRVLPFLYPNLNLDPKPTLNLCEDVRMIDLMIDDEEMEKDGSNVDFF